MSLQRCQSETTSTEFEEWQAYFRLEAEQSERGHYYLAQIALEVRRSFAKHPERLRLEDFMLRFSSTNRSKKEEEDEAAARQARVTASKAAWLAAVGIRQPPQN